ncbi:PHD finger protein 21A-like isoform X2 [Acanthaster planci]|uniref:PHD finger protein 21A-like isoform X2 n=1 Tax=Acanthaster planci TaxID=133434 RepID=A0A8B7XPY8_ACAPL|nr:PHD finger protein 21A-like isoform X2 [Acanthaster planci]
MSNAELEKLQMQLRREIQSHQILVAKMKNDPQNVELKKQLHDQQAKITTLSEKQKKVVEQLRSDLGIQKESPVGKNEQVTSTPLTTSQNLNIPNRAVPTSTAAISKTPPGAQRGSSQHHHHQHQSPTTPTRMSILTNKPTTVTIKVPNVASRLAQSKHTPAGQPLQKEPSSPSNLYKKLTALPRPSAPGHGGVRNNATKKPLSPEEQKLEFMASLGLITQKTAEQLRCKRSERKRRSTANPQFSNYDRQEMESRQSATRFLEANGFGQEKRKRGKFHKGSEGSADNAENNLNGTLHKQEVDKHQDHCSACGLATDELLMCDTCPLVYHLGCLDPPLSAVPPGMWSCPQCKLKGSQSDWHGTLAIVHSYVQHRTMKEEEKRRLQKRASELQNERVQLEDKARQLNDAIAKQMQARDCLTESFRKTEKAIVQLQGFISRFQV